jgi:hypothetical protein
MVLSLVTEDPSSGAFLDGFWLRHRASTRRRSLSAHVADRGRSVASETALGRSLGTVRARAKRLTEGQGHGKSKSLAKGREKTVLVGD